MRFVSMDYIKPGMRLGKNLYNENGILILSENVILSEPLIELLFKQGYPGLYIKDEISKDIEVREIVSAEIRTKVKQNIKKLLSNNSSEISLEMRKALSEDINDILESILEDDEVMVNMIDLKKYNDYAFCHSVNVGILSGVIGAGLKLNEDMLKHTITAGLLHDIGKKFIPDSILDKQGKLDNYEMSVIKKHPVLGYNYLKANMNLSAHVLAGILLHHEKYNGTGYPYQRKGEDITLIGRIIAVADVYDAITSKRPYHDAFSPSEAFEFIMGNSGLEFDPQVVNVFVSRIAIYPVGTEVLLSNGETALVMENYPGFSTRPLVKVLSSGKMLNLKSDPETRSITVVKSLLKI